jgi:hypothetical protein
MDDVTKGKFLALVIRAISLRDYPTAGCMLEDFASSINEQEAIMVGSMLCQILKWENTESALRFYELLRNSYRSGVPASFQGEKL